MKKTHKLLILLALVCTLVVCCMVSASAAKEIVIDGVNYYTDDDGKYLFQDSLGGCLIGVTDAFDNTGWEFCGGYYYIDGEMKYTGIFGSTSGTRSIYPLKTFTRVSLISNAAEIDSQMITANAFSWMTVTGEFYIPETVDIIFDSAFAFTRVGSFRVNTKNKNYSNDDLGILYRHSALASKERFAIVMAPDKTVDDIVIPDDISYIAPHAFYHYEGKTITIPVGMNEIGSSAFPCLALGSTDKFDAVYYEGTIDQWNEIEIGDSNGRITKAHLFCNDWYTVSEQGCFTDEVERRDCHCSDDCGEYETRVIKEAFGSHNFTEQLGAVRSTCATQGYIEYHCSRCDRVKVYEPLDETNHEGPYGTRNAKTATCITAGKLADTYCTACGVTTEVGAETDPAIGEHTMIPFYESGYGCATCVSSGNKIMRCIYYNTCMVQTVTQVSSDPGVHPSSSAIKIRNKVENTCCDDGYNGDYYCELCNNNLHTCEPDGKRDPNCHGCVLYPYVNGLLSKPKIFKATGKHTFGDWETIVAPTCVAVGEERRDCTVGEAFETNALPINSEAHAYEDNWKVVKEPSCIEGEEERFCILCGDGRETRAIEANGEHVWKDWIVWKHPTCTTPGEKYHFCKNCSAKETEVLPVVEHEYHHVPSYIVSQVDPTCTTPGVANYRCYWYKECKTTEPGEISVVDHVFENYEVTTPATCINTGIETAKCKWYDECHETKDNPIAPTDTHIFDKAYEVLRGQCDREGYMKFKCIADPDCTEIKTETLAVDPELHNSGYNFDVNKKDVTCCADGYTGDDVCKGCDAITRKGEVIPATGEHPGYNEIVGEGTCATVGYVRRYCNVSGLSIYFEQGSKNPDRHLNLVTVNQKTSTCKERGYTGDKQCSGCKKIMEKGKSLSYASHKVGANGSCSVCGADSCNHMCHKNDGKGTGWYRFCLFFWKIFNVNQKCKCGVAHY